MNVKREELEQLTKEEIIKLPSEAVFNSDGNAAQALFLRHLQEIVALSENAKSMSFVRALNTAS